MTEHPAKQDRRKRRFALFRPRSFWYVACPSRALGRHPIRRMILGTPLVLYRGAEGRAVALLDRCAHRNAPLSMGRVVEGRIECPYHGWQYDESGRCRVIPWLNGAPEGKARCVPRYPTVEQQGFVWVAPLPDGDPPPEPPYPLSHVGEAGFTTVHFEAVLRCSLYSAIENFLDVPHTAFLHKGLFRSGRRSAIRVAVKRTRDRVEATFLGEPCPRGLMGRILAPEGGLVFHVDRFVLPAITEVEYRLSDRTEVVTTSLLTPERPFLTRLHVAIRLRLPFPPALVKPILRPVAKKVFDQDVVMLEAQTRTTRALGGEQYVSTELDVLGRHVWYLLRRAEAGSRLDDSPVFEEEVTFAPSG